MRLSAIVTGLSTTDTNVENLIKKNSFQRNVGGVLAPLLQIEDLHTEFRTGAGIVRAVDGISYTVERGETVAIVGESGSGKSVGALSILRLIPDPPGRITRGEILFAGSDLMQLSDAQMREVRPVASSSIRTNSRVACASAS